MAYSEEHKEKIFNYIFDEIIKGRALRNILKDENMPDVTTFYVWIEKDEQKAKQYARATELRAEAIFEEILEIADDSSGDIVLNKDGVEVLNTEFVQRSRLKVDTRKWIASKLNPKKYGDKMDVTSDGKGLDQTIKITIKKNEDI